MTGNTVSKFEELVKLNVNDKVEKKKSGNTELTYLSWAFAVAEMEKAYPEWEYDILEFNGLPYQFDPNTGYLVWTEIKAGGKTKKMWLPVMDASNKAMKDKSYSYFVKGWNGAPPVEKFVEAATMFDINKTIMRCLVKNIAMFGIGLYIYTGEDLPEGEENKKPENDKGFFKEPAGALANIAAQGNQEMQEKKAEKKAVDTEEKLKKEEEGLKRLKTTLVGFGSVAEIEGYLNEIPSGSKSTRLQAINRMSEINAGQAKVIIRDAKFAVDPEYKGE